MYELTIKNFQSISNLTLPIKGFTALVGKSNRGKSAILRALRTVLLNEWNSAYIKAGTKETEITFKITEQSDYLKALFPDMDIEEIKVNKPSNEYSIFLSTGDVLKYPKVGKNTPEKMESLNLAGIVTEREDIFNLIFQTQLEPLFLITGTEVEITSFINKVFDISRFEKALREMKSDDIKLARELIEIDNTTQSLQIEKETVRKEIDVVKDNVSALEVKLNTVEATEASRKEITGDLLRLQELSKTLQELEHKKILVLAQKKYLTVLTDMESATKETVSYRKDQEMLRGQKESIERISIILPLHKELSNIPAQVYSHVTKLFEMESLQRLNKSVKGLSALPIVYKGVKEKIEIIHSGVELLSHLGSESKQVSSLFTEVSDIRREISWIKPIISDIDVLKSDLLGHLQICPVCEQLICKESTC